MFITPHTSVALWLSTKISDPILAFFCGLVSHFILDMIPHGDEHLGEHKQTKKGRFFYLMQVATVDVLVAVAMIYFFISNGPVVDNYVLFAVVLGAWLPDMAWIAIENFKITSLYWYIVYHGKLHNLFDWQYSIVYGVPFQILVTLFMLKISF